MCRKMVFKGPNVSSLWNIDPFGVLVATVATGPLNWANRSNPWSSWIGVVPPCRNVGGKGIMTRNWGKHRRDRTRERTHSEHSTTQSNHVPTLTLNLSEFRSPKYQGHHRLLLSRHEAPTTPTTKRISTPYPSCPIYVRVYMYISEHRIGRTCHGLHGNRRSQIRTYRETNKKRADLPGSISDCTCSISSKTAFNLRCIVRVFTFHLSPTSSVARIADLANAVVVVISAGDATLWIYLVREVPLADATKSILIGKGVQCSIGEDGERAEGRGRGPQHVLWLALFGRQTLGMVSRCYSTTGNVIVTA